MRWLRVLRLRWRSLFHVGRMEQELEREFRFHLEQQVEENRAAGMAPDAARSAALRAIGGLTQFQDECRSVRGTDAIADLRKDIHFAIRLLRRAPGHTAIAIATLALGIGLATTMFSLLYSAWLGPLPYADAGRLVDIRVQGRRLAGGTSWPGMMDWKAQDHLFTDLAAYLPPDSINLTGAGQAEEVIMSRVSSNLFPLLGTPPAIGRYLTADGDRQSGPPQVILSYGYWQTHFGGDPNVAGRAVSVNGEKYTVMGVMPKGFVFPPDARVWKPVVWLSLRLPPQEMMEHDTRSLYVVGRLKPAVLRSAAQAEIETIQARLREAFHTPDTSAVVTGLADSQTARDARPGLLMLMAAVGLVLLTGCVNVANLQLARATSRRREFAVRLAMGVSRRRLARQLLTETCLLGLAGGTLGLALVWWGIHAIERLLPGSIATVAALGLNPMVLSFSLACSVLAGIAFGMVPAIQAGHVSVDQELKQGGKTSSTHGGVSRALVAIEVALALVLLSAGGLLIESYRRVSSVELGFEARHVLTARLPLPRRIYTSGRQVEAFRDEVLRRVRALPGVQYAATVSDLPMGILTEGTGFEMEGRPSASPPVEGYAKVSTEYFEAMGIPLAGGRYFGKSDLPEAQPVAVISQSLAARYWPDGDALGRRVRLGGTRRTDWFTIIGIVKDVREYGPEQEPDRKVYVLNGQVAELVQRNATSRLNTLVIRSVGDPASLTPPVRAVVAGIDRDQPLADVLTLPEVLGKVTAGRRLNAILLGTFGSLALLLAGIGVFGVVSYSVAERTREIGIRVALGATAAGVVRAMMRDSLRMGMTGVAVGGVATALSSSMLSRFLFGVRPFDPLLLAGVAGILTGIVLAGAWWPARRALRVDPVEALRNE